MPRQAGFDTSVCFECAFWALPLQAMGKKHPAFRSVKQEKITVHGYNLLYVLPAKYSFSCSMACRVRKNPSKHLIKTHPGRVWRLKKKPWLSAGQQPTSSLKPLPPSQQWEPAVSSSPEQTRQGNAHPQLCWSQHVSQLHVQPSCA